MLNGLRIRLVALLALACAVALGVLAAALLGPLERRLLDDEIEGLRLQARRDLPVLVEAAGQPPRGSAQLRAAARRLQRDGGAEVSVVRADGAVMATTDPDRTERFPDAVQALREQRILSGRIGKGVEEEIGVAVPGSGGVAVAFRKPLDDVRSAAAVVRRAFLVAAIASLIVAVMLGSVLAGRVIYRLRTLRDTSLHVAEHGPMVTYEPDRARDEVGDLTRAFALMQQRLREQEEARRTFVATASHELRTPLTSLRVMLDVLRDVLDAPVPDVAEARRQVELADRQAVRLAGLSAELLDLSRIDAGVPLRSELLELDEIACAVVAEFGVRTAETGRRLELDAPGAVWATGDPGSVAQIVRLLIDNALRHGEGTVTATVHGVGDLATISVRDAGPGVPREDRERVFERFERGSSASRGPGFGLGLAIGRELAQRMGGDLRLAPARERPATFVLTLPISSSTDVGMEDDHHSEARTRRP